MKTVFNLRAITKRMKNKPQPAMAVYNFMDGANTLSTEQINEFERVVDKGYQEMKQHISQQRGRL